jgi:peptidoglycan/LPS O-acetylase OafA/YrhL
VPTMTLAPARTHVTRRLAVSMLVLVVTDLAGGLVAVATGVNTWADAWGGRALLAAPLPMVAVQVLLAWLAVHRDRRWAALPAGLLCAACLVSVVSGFVDGGLAHEELSAALVGFQLVLLTVTASVGLIAAARARELLLRA